MSAPRAARCAPCGFSLAHSRASGLATLPREGVDHSVMSSAQKSLASRMYSVRAAPLRGCRREPQSPPGTNADAATRATHAATSCRGSRQCLRQELMRDAPFEQLPGGWGPDGTGVAASTSSLVAAVVEHDRRVLGPLPALVLRPGAEDEAPRLCEGLTAGCGCRLGPLLPRHGALQAGVGERPASLGCVFASTARHELASAGRRASATCARPATGHARPNACCRTGGVCSVRLGRHAGLAAARLACPARLLLAKSQPPSPPWPRLSRCDHRTWPHVGGLAPPTGLWSRPSWWTDTGSRSRRPGRATTSCCAPVSACPPGRSCPATCATTSTCCVATGRCVPCGWAAACLP